MDSLVNVYLDKLFPILNTTDKSELKKHTIFILRKLQSKIKSGKFIQQLQINGGLDIISVIKMLLPYIPDDKTKQLESFSQITKKKDEMGRYVFSTMAYGPLGKNEFNIRKNVKKLGETIDLVINKLYVNWVNVIPKLSTKKGVDSELRFNPDRDDGENKENIRTNLDIDKYKKAIYFLTGEKYSKLDGLLKDEKGEDILVHGKYFDFLKNHEDPWYLAFGLNWVSQINFFHHFINNRVIMVTGSTGAGKSTQVPKLLLYALKALKGKDGRIIVTQPRIKPSVDNPTFVSIQMGVPTDTGNYYLQYKNSQHDHTSNQKPYLKMVTDATLLNELIDDPELKKYDIVAIDEVHEHNTNMDIILTLMKRTLEINPDIKLVLISATLEADEPRYRQFYKHIPDEFILDRRFDISVPGTGTRYEITDVYDPIMELGVEKIDDKLLDKIINKTIEIVNNNSGNILLFVTGQYDIKYICEKIVGEDLIPDILLVPFYREVINNHSELVNGELLRIDASKIKYSRKYLNQELLGIGYDNVSKYHDGRYRFKLVIATSIAEASITIPGMINVIDMGLVKYPKHNVKINKSDLKIKAISKSNQMQRRGRVGRIAPGNVFYLYPPEMIPDTNKEGYGIVNENMQMVILKLLGNCPPSQDLLGAEGSKGNEEFHCYGKEDLFDKSGDFYMIHPDELTIVRDENGEIIDGELPRIEETFKLLEKMKLIDEDGNKTKLGELVGSMSMQELDEENENSVVGGVEAVITFLYSVKLKCPDEILFILSALSNSPDILGLFINQDKRIRGRYIHSSINSDHITLYNIYNKFRIVFPHLVSEGKRKVYQAITDEDLIEYARLNNIEVKKDGDYIENYTDLYTGLRELRDNESNREFYDDNIKWIKRFMQDNHMTLSINFKNDYKVLLNKVKDTEKELIDEWCRNNYIEPAKFQRILSLFFTMKSALNQRLDKIKQNTPEITNFLVNKIKWSSDINQDILQSIYQGFQNNILYRQNGNIYHINQKDEPIIKVDDKKPVKYRTTFRNIGDSVLYIDFTERDWNWQITGVTNLIEFGDKIRNKVFRSL